MHIGYYLTFISLKKILFLKKKNKNLQLSLFSLVNEYHTAPTKHLVNFTDLNWILRLEIFLHKDGQLRATHVILEYRPSTKHF